MADDVSFGTHLQQHDSNLRLAILLSNLVHNIPLTAYLEANRDLPTAFETVTVSSWNTLSQTAKDEALHKVLGLLRQRYSVSPPTFGSCPFIRTSPDGRLTVCEELDPRILQHVKSANEILAGADSLQLIDRRRLASCRLSPTYPKSWSSQVTLATSSACPSDKPYIAKGPSQLSGFAELRALLSLPRHPNIVPPPLGLITVAPDDPRVLGFLLEYYPLGNLDDYAGRIYLEGKLTPQKVWDWGRQIVDAMHWLHAKHHTLHGDLKADNILLASIDGGRERLVLIDFSQDAFTAATAAPELREGWQVRDRDGSVEYVSDGIELAPRCSWPKENPWPKEAVERAEVYSIGRTLHILSKGASMTSLYMKLYEDIDYVYETTWEENEMPGKLGAKLKALLTKCTAKDPMARPRLAELKSIFEGAHDGEEDGHAVKNGAAKRTKSSPRGMAEKKGVLDSVYAKFRGLQAAATSRPRQEPVYSG